MVRLNDLILLAVLVVSVLAGILLPEIGRWFQPVLTYFIMILLFLSFLPIEMRAIWEVFRRSGWILVGLTLLKMILMPTAVYFIFRAFHSDFALAALLLSGISTGVVAPFISNLVQGNSPLVLALVVVTSFLAPFTLPALVETLAGRTIEIPLTGMMILLGKVIFLPMLAVNLLRRALPAFVPRIRRWTFPMSLTIFAAINLGVFSRYADFFRQQPAVLVSAVLAACVLGGLYLSLGLLIMWPRPVEDQLAAAITLANMNNVLVIVFASHFFGPLEPTLAAMYMFPFFGLIVPLRVFRRWRSPGFDFSR